MTKVSPSILSCRFRQSRARYPRDGARKGRLCSCRRDGRHFCSQHYDRSAVVASIRKVTELPLDVHLMIDRPIRYVEQFCKAGADILTIHVEADTAENTRKALEIIQGCGVTPAISIKPKTPAESVLPFLDLCGLILVMTVEPGFGGQSFMADLMPKLQAVRSYIDEKNPTCELEVDGGINPETAKVCIAHGANVLVAGSAYFKSADKAAFVRSIKE